MECQRIDRFHSFLQGVQPALAAGYDGSDTIPTTIDRIKRSMAEH